MMDDQALCYLSLQALSNHLRGRMVTSVEATRVILNRVRAYSGLNAYLLVLEETALRAAEQADRELRAGVLRGPLHGVPLAVKDLCWIKGVPTTCASRVLRDWRPGATATVVERLEAAGAIIIGKLNHTEFAVAWYHPELPVPQNPWGSELWPGASSSGSGVATAAGTLFWLARLRHWRFDSSTVRILRHRRTETNLGSGESLWCFPAC
jgi:amidase